MKGMMLYRLIAFVVNGCCLLLAVMLIPLLLIVFSNPAMALNLFILAGVVLYAWYANLFFTRVIVQKAGFTKRQKDWLQVNSILAFLFGALSLGQSILFLRRPALLQEQLGQQQLPVASPEKLMTNVLIALLVFSLLLLVHIGWTFFLLRRHNNEVTG